MIELHLKVAGVLFLLLALIHAGFPRYFNWARELSGLSLINRELMYVHTLFVAFSVLLMGILCLHSPAALAGTKLGKDICLGLGAFWLLRLLIQFFGYSPALWKGKRKETLIHILFSLLWAYFTLLFLMVYFSGSTPPGRYAAHALPAQPYCSLPA